MSAGPTRIVLATWNAGRGGTGRDLRGLLRNYQPDALAGNEWADRHELLLLAKIRGYRALVGDGDPGEASTPVFASPDTRVRHEVSRLLLPRQSIGPGAGPDRNKPKSIVGGLLSEQGTVFGVVSTHLVASQQHERREEAADDQVRGLLDKLDHRHFPWFVLGDFNTTPDDPNGVLRPLYARGWTNTHRQGGVLATHGHRAIDYVWWRRDPRVRFVGHEAVRTHSDHRALVATFEVSN